MITRKNVYKIPEWVLTGKVGITTRIVRLKTLERLREQLKKKLSLCGESMADCQTEAEKVIDEVFGVEDKK
jgi:hypothetical protein